MRSLTTIIFTDIEGYTSLMQEDENRAIKILNKHRTCFRTCMDKYGGIIVQYYGDGTLSTFSSAVMAVRSAIELQQILRTDPVVPLRIGIHVGEVVRQEDGIVGDAVNIASRVESLSVAGSIIISQAVYDQIYNQADIKCERFGTFIFKNVSKAIDVYAIKAPGVIMPREPHKSAKILSSGFVANLPIYPQKFIGRAKEIQEIITHLQDPGTRLVTLMGSGGLGKTRIVVEIINQGLFKMRQGVTYVSLDGIEDPNFIYKAIGESLHLMEQGELTWQMLVLKFLAEKEILIVLDNFEHLLSGRTVIEEIVNSCRQVKFLITSRTTLNLTNEVEFRIQPFTVPPASSVQTLEEFSNIEAVSLFLQIARQVKTFTLNRQNAEVILKICQELEGVPLAIELAASRLKILSPQQILDRLRDIFSLLKSQRFAKQKRHQTIYATIRWSYDLLSDEQKMFFRAFSIFNVSFTLAGAEAVMPEIDALEAIESLLNHSLIRRLEGSTDEPRFGMLRTIREFGKKELEINQEECQLIRDRYINYYIDFLQGNNQMSLHNERSTWLKNIEAEIDNIRAIGAHFINTRDLRLRSFLVLFWRYYLLRGHLKEGYELSSQAIATATGKSDALQGKLLSAAGTFAHNLGAFKAAKNNFSEALKIFMNLEVPLETCRTLNHLAWAEFRLGGYVRCESYADAALDLAEKHQFTTLKATALNNRAWVAMFRGNYLEAMGLQNVICEIYKDLKDERSLAFSKTNMGWVLINLNKKEEAIDLLEEALTTFESLGDRQLLAFTICIKSLTVSGTEINALLQKSISIFSDIGDGWGLGLAIQFQAYYYFQRKELADAESKLKSSFKIRRKINDTWGIIQCHILWGRLHLHSNNLFEAQRHLSKAFQMAEQMQTPGPLKNILALLGHIDLRQGHEEKSKIRFERAIMEAKKQGNMFLEDLKDQFKNDLTTLDLKNSTLDLL